MPVFFSYIILFLASCANTPPTIVKFLYRFFIKTELNSPAVIDYFKACGVDIDEFLKELENPDLIQQELSGSEGSSCPFHRSIWIFDKLFQIAPVGTHAHMVYLLAVLYTDSPISKLLSTHRITSTRVAKFLNIKLSQADAAIVVALAKAKVEVRREDLLLHTPNGVIPYRPTFLLVRQQAPQPAGRIDAPVGNILEQHCVNLTGLAIQGKIPQIIGREKELQLVIETLLRKKKNCPILIGEPGSGKTAIAEGLAWKIAHNQVPKILQGVNVYSLDITSLLAGTSYRGQLESRLVELIKQIQTTPKTMLFIDEIHMLANTGESSNMANMLKPALASGDFPCMGATTYEEYRKFIENDGALSRRFSPIHIKEPTEEDTLEILKGIKPAYEELHKVHYSDDMLQKIVSLSGKYLTSQKFPDKAVDILDVVGVKARLSCSLNPEAISAARQLVESFSKDSVNQEVSNVITTALNQIQDHQTDTPVNVGINHIYAAISQRANIPYHILESSDNSQDELYRINDALVTQVIGQPEAIDKIMRNLKKRIFNLLPINRPQGSFLFAGSTGVGKTLIAQVLAKELYHTKDSYIKLDMSEYMEKASVARLIGAPPGYIGYENAGQLSERLRRNPYSLVLVDEIDKAHEDVLNIFLQILEDGRFTDSHGVEIPCNHATFIFTTNAGVAQFTPKESVGFLAQTKTPDSEDTRAILTNYFRPEFLNRLDSIIAFKPFSEESLRKIVKLELSKLQKRLEDKCTITLTKGAIEKILELSDYKNCGAREIRRLVEQRVADIAVEAILDGKNEIRIAERDLVLT